MSVRTFKFDVILGEEDLCDRVTEMKRLCSVLKRKGRLVVYSIRRMGKTSLVNVCSKKIREENPRAFHLYVDLNEANSLEEVARRFHAHCEMAFNRQFPVQRVKTILNDLLSRLKVNITSGIELSLEKIALKQPEQYLLQLFYKLAEISEKFETILIIDEFQAIANLSNVQALLRREFQQLSKAAIVLMGSNQRLLYGIFNDKNLPFFGFGEDLELGEIGIDDYLPYLNERFSARDLSIDKDTAQYMLDKMNNIPNYINELGAWIVDNYSNLELTDGQIDSAFEAAVDSKRGRYASALYAYSNNEKRFIRSIAKIGRVKKYSGQLMQELTQLPSSELTRVKKDLEDCPILSIDTRNQLFIIDPFMRRFIEVMS